MTPRHTTPEAAAPAQSPRFLPALVLLFIGSGCAALIYEVVWFQLVSLIIGSSAISLGVLLATFMGGMCIGSLYLSRFVSASAHPMRVYALLEAGIGLCGLIILLILPWVGGLYTAIGGSGMSGLLMRGLFCALCLLPPTIMMGATLPAIARWVEATPRGVAWLGFFYGGNTAGAVLGCVLAGFFLLRIYDTTVATFVAAALNFSVAGAGLLLAKRTAHTPPVTDEAKKAAGPIPATAWPVLVTIGLSGMVALGAQAVWTRLLTLLLGGTVYTFSLIVAAFLTGLGIGSGAGSFLARSVRDPRLALGLCQLLIIAGLAWAAWSFAEALPYWPINPALAMTPGATFQIDMIRCLWVCLPAATLWGASFPLALAAVASKRQDPGRLVGVVYAANTVGAIAGALIGSMLIIKLVGTQNAQRFLIALTGVAALVALLPVATEQGKLAFRRGGLGWAVATVAFAAWMISGVTRIPGLLVAYGRYMVTWIESAGELIYVGEGMNSSMAVSVMSDGTMNYHNAGKVQASSDPVDMRLQRMLGHITTLLPANPRNVLVIGCGAGVTAGAVSIDPAVERVTIAEIEPLVPEVVSRYFSDHNFAVVTNPKVHLEIDDARHFLLTTDQKFDAITSDPFDPWVKGAATLYTREFFELAKRKLNPGGVITVFVQLYEAGEPAVKSEIATFLEVFPNGVVFGNTSNGSGYDLVLMGQVEPTPIDIDAIDAKLRSPEYAQVAFSLSQIGFYSALDLFSTFAGKGPELLPWLRDAQINRDRNLRLQYLAGLGLNKYEQGSIYAGMLQHRQYPEGLFTGSPETLQRLRMAIGWMQ